METKCTIYIEDKYNKLMNCFDLADGGMKVFIRIFEMTLNNTTDEKVKNMLTTMLTEKDSPKIVYAQAGKYYGFRDKKHKMFSDGEHFVFKTDMLEALKDLEEIKVGE